MQPITTLTIPSHALRFGRNERPSPAPPEPMEQPIEQAEDAANHQPLPPVHLPVGPTQLGQGGALNFFYHNADTGHVQHSNDIVALLNLAISGERRLQRTSQSHEASAERSQTPRNGAVVLNPQGGGYHSAFYELA